MSVNILVITHNQIGQELVETALTTIQSTPMQIRTLSVPMIGDIDDIFLQAQALVHSLNAGDGVLILTDLYGSTPANIATQLLPKSQVKVVSGVNLPMLIRTLNYPNLSLTELALKAYSGGQEGVFLCTTDIRDAIKCNES
ncbi:MAG TPA: PTS fructose transporter subunit IIA [Gammaproteobacteria bacterium]|nr:PTS fructose transporter subunit IIA [Gammaproteobacteria bacterium]